ncbi:MAG: L-arabinose isomerase [Bacilli bacterium]|jgi:L-arabinose isomerase|nr:L-arabinose isomerase [Bacilli bacterium]MCH4278355.1 L-arabinose isomerase [Bacilli bacterium]
MENKHFDFIIGSQDLYGEGVLTTIEERGKEMAAELSKHLPFAVIFKGIVRINEDAVKLIKNANYDDGCAGIIAWCHTFSPSKMWINGLELLQKPYLHLLTQYNAEIPNEGIDMDFMNLNQAAHGDREHSFILARMRVPHKIIAGYWKDEEVVRRIGKWEKVAVAASNSHDLKIMRLGDNMREVAVTEGDKIEAQERLGWQVNTFPVGELAELVKEVTDEEAEKLVSSYKKEYETATDNEGSILYQAKEEIAIKKMLASHGCSAFSTNFQDLYGLRQLPGLAAQHLMEEGCGFGAEGDWKVAGLGYLINQMGEGNSSFIEAYTYDFLKDGTYSLGAHMLEVNPRIASKKPRIEVHPLGIGGKEDPARLVFEGKAGKATFSSLIDMGGRLRLIVQDIECVKPTKSMPNLPVARVMWKSLSSFTDALECWSMAGGSHHTVLSYDVDAEQLHDWAKMVGIEFVHIGKNTTPESLEKELFYNDVAWKLRQ